MNFEYEFTLGEAFELQMGKTPARDNPLYWGGGNKWISIADIKEKHVVDTKECISDLAVQETKIKIVPKGTPIMSFKLSVGKVAFTAEDMYTNEAIMAFIDRGKYPIDKEYLFHYLENQDWQKGANKTVKGLTINKKSLSARKIGLPSLDTQRERANTLNLLDREIQLCRKLLKTADTLVEARFFEMFGDPLSNPLQWNEQPLGDVCSKVIRYPTFYGMEYLDTGTRVIRIGNILADGRMETGDKDYVFVYDTVNDDFPETVIEMNDIVMAVRGDGSAAKRIGIITEPILVGANISPNLIRIKVDSDKLNPIYMFYYLTGEVGQKRLDAYVNKTAKKNIAAKDIVKIVVPVPPLPLQQAFADFVADVDKSKFAVTKCLKKAEYLKSALMQQYFG